uniref:proline-rich protein 2-like n=1 Tax=Agelaius phoeniceus TaxID=39638 RepID=UPI0023ED721C|nr:proline-rich protein 2-like [Agelaius phoeniceus]
MWHIWSMPHGRRGAHPPGLPEPPRGLGVPQAPAQHGAQPQAPKSGAAPPSSVPRERRPRLPRAPRPQRPGLPGAGAARRPRGPACRPPGSRLPRAAPRGAGRRRRPRARRGIARRGPAAAAAVLRRRRRSAPPGGRRAGTAAAPASPAGPAPPAAPPAPGTLAGLAAAAARDHRLHGHPLQPRADPDPAGPQPGRGPRRSSGKPGLTRISALREGLGPRPLLAGGRRQRKHGLTPSCAGLQRPGEPQPHPALVQDTGALALTIPAVSCRMQEEQRASVHAVTQGGGHHRGIHMTEKKPTSSCLEGAVRIRRKKLTDDQTESCV